MALFDRVVSIVIGNQGEQGREIKDLRIAFSIQKGSTQIPNKSTVRVYNANPDTRKLMETVGIVIILKAGYRNDVGLVTIFSGEVTRAISVREGPDWITEFEMFDGFVEFRDMKISVSYSQNTSAAQVIQEIAKKFRLPVRPFPKDIKDKIYPAGFAFVGRLRDAMNKACDYIDLEWSIQNREVQILRKGSTLNTTAYVLSPNTGLIASPIQESKTITEKSASKLGFTKNSPGVFVTEELFRDTEPETMLRVLGYKVKSLLQPLAEPGMYVQLKSKSIDGEFFRIESLTHIGDTMSNEWFTDLVLRYTK